MILLRPGSDSVPLEFFDDQSFYRGISADYVALIEQRLGLRFQVVRSRSGALGQLFGDVRPLLAPTPEREKVWSFTGPYLELPAYLITRASARDGLTLSDLEGARVAVVVNYAAGDYVAARFPGVVLDPVPDNRTGLRKVSFGLADAFVSDLPVATYRMEKEGITNLKVGGETGFVYRMGMASRSDWPELHRILEKGLSLVTPAEREEIYHRWVKLAPRPGPSRRFTIAALLALGASALALAGVLLWNRTLSARVARHTRELRILNDGNLALARSLDLERVLGTLLDTVRELVPYDSANVMLVEGGRLVQRAERGYEQWSGRSHLGAFPVEHPFWWDSLERGSVVIADAAREPRWLPVPGCEHVRSWLAVPLRASGQLIGLFSLDKSEAGFFTSEHVRLAEALAGPAAVALENARLYAESQRAEAAMRRSEEKFVKAFRSSPVPLTLATFPEGRFVDVNEAFLRGSGYGREVIGQTTSEVGSWPDEGRRQQLLDQLRLVSRVTNEEFQYRTRSGELRTGIISMELVHIAGETYILAGSFDITERKRMEDALRASEDRFLTIFRLSPIPMSIATLDEGRLVHVNDAYSRITGYSRDELIGKTTTGLGLVDRAVREAVVRQYDAQGRLRNREVEVVTRSGERRTAMLSSDIISLEGAPHTLVAAFDITEHRRLEEELRQAQKMEAIGQLAGGVAHDFNNMLMAITAHCDLLALELRDAQAMPAEPIRATIDDIQQVAGKAAKLTRQLLTFSRKQALQPRLLDLNAVVEEWSRMIRRLIGATVEIRFRPAEGLGRVHGDPGAIEQVLMNLCLNARDAMPEGGVLTIATGNEDLAHPLHAPHGVLSPGRYVALTVADTGTGMDAATASRIFEPFFTTKAPGKGTGLGLSTVYGIVGQSGGTIGVTTEPGRGSTFKVLLPGAEAEPAVAEERATTAPERGTETILFVEDDEEVQQMAAEYLRSVGYHVWTARTPAEALARVADGGPGVDLLLTDVELPGGSGPRLARELCARRAGLKVLFLSGQAHYALEAHGLRPDTILGKPFPLGVLAERIRLVLDADQAPLPTGSERNEK